MPRRDGRLTGKRRALCSMGFLREVNRGGDFGVGSPEPVAELERFVTMDEVPA
jgi:hypothetical protein